MKLPLTERLSTPNKNIENNPMQRSPADAGMGRDGIHI